MENNNTKISDIIKTLKNKSNVYVIMKVDGGTIGCYCDQLNDDNLSYIVKSYNIGIEFRQPTLIFEI